MDRYRKVTLIAGLLTLAAGCTANRWDQDLRAGRHLEVVRSYEADSSAQDQERALFVTGLSYASQDSPEHDLSLARRLFERLVQLYPESRHRVVVDPVLTLYAKLDEKSEEVQAVEAERDSARAEVERLKGEVERMRMRSELYSDLSRHFRRAMALRDARARTLERQLEELKRIDLQR